VEQVGIRSCTCGTFPRFPQQVGSSVLRRLDHRANYFGFLTAARLIFFSMVRSSTAVTADCLANAKGRVTISPLGAGENLHAEGKGVTTQYLVDVRNPAPDKPLGLDSGFVALRLRRRKPDHTTFG